MIENFKIKGGLWVKALLVCVAFIGVLSSSAFSEPIGVMSFIDDGGIPPAGSIVFTSYYNNDDVKIQTEDSDNGGYSNITGACVASTPSFNGDQTGQAYTIYISRPGANKWGTGTNALLPGSGVAYTTPGTSLNKIILSSTNYVGLPQNVRAYKGNGRVVLKWDAPATGTPTGYRVYRRPSATEASTTEVIFDRRGTPTSIDFEDTTTNGSFEAYIICAYNASGYGPHTDEIAITADAAAADPNVAAPTPASSSVGASLTISGTNFGATHGVIEFNGAKVTSGAIWTSTSITVLVPLGVTTGKFYVVDSTGRVSNGWTLTIGVPGGPDIASCTPARYIGDSSVTMSVVGTNTNFVNGTTTATVNPATGITVNSVTVSDTTHAVINVTIASAATAGSRDITLKTNTEYATGEGLFVISAPSFTSITPNSGNQGATLTGVAIVGTGTHFTGTPTVNFGSNITVSNISVSNATLLTCDIVIDASAATGARNVVVTTGGETVTGTNVFTVNAPGNNDWKIYERTGGIMMAYPNPFNPLDKTKPLSMLFGAATGEAVDIYIFDTNGRVIYQDRNVVLEANVTSYWNGHTSYGEVVENGLYLIRVVKDGKLVAKGKILVIKK